MVIVEKMLVYFVIRFSFVSKKGIEFVKHFNGIIYASDFALRI